MFDTPEEDAAKAAATKAQQDAIDAAVTKAMEKPLATITALHAQVRVLEKGAPKKEDKPAPEPGSPEAKQAELDRQIADFKAHKQRVQTRAVRNELQTAAIGLGLEKDALADFVDLTLVRDGSKIAYDEASDSVKVQLNEVDGAVTVTEWLKTRDAKGELNRYKPAKGTPTKGAGKDDGSNGGADVVKIKRSDLAAGKYDPKILTGKFEVLEE